MAEIKPVSYYITDNTLKSWYALDKAMYEAHFKDENEHAESTARLLLQNTDLPLLLRCRACMILGCSEHPDFLTMAKEAVRVAQMGCDMWPEGQPNARSDQLLKNAQRVLEEAQVAFDEIAAEEKADEKQSEPILDDSADEETAAVATATATNEPETADAGEKKNSRRLITGPTKMISTSDTPPR